MSSSDNTYNAKVGDVVEGWLCYPSYYPSEGDTEPGPTLFVNSKEPNLRGGFCRIKKVKIEILSDDPT